MIVIKALEKESTFDIIAIKLINKVNSERGIVLFLILLAFFFSIFLTNDVALLTLVPFALIISRKITINIEETIILQAIAANIGSSLTPIGNPQNLFLYYFYHLSFSHFILITYPISLIGLVFLCFNTFRFSPKNKQLFLESEEIRNKKQLLIYLGLFLLILLGILRIFDYRIIFVIIFGFTFIFNRSIIKKVDYSLLLTFICFFIFIGNISQIPNVSEWIGQIMNGNIKVFMLSILSSQFISNVPTAILFSSFTTYYRPLILGVNVGGLGTLIASLASLIAYRLYKQVYNRPFLGKFILYNLIYLVILMITGYFMIIL